VRLLLLTAYVVLAGVGQSLHYHPVCDPPLLGNVGLSSPRFNFGSHPTRVVSQTVRCNDCDDCPICTWGNVTKSQFSAPTTGALVVPCVAPTHEWGMPQCVSLTQTPPPPTRAPPQI
jgi:hypothetical protein